MNQRNKARIAMLSNVPLLMAALILFENNYTFLCLVMMLLMLVGAIYLASIKYSSKPYAKDDAVIYALMFLAYMLFIK